jgi:hypothetical protein
MLCLYCCYCIVPAYFIVPKPLTFSKNNQQRPGYEAGDLLNNYVFFYNEDVKYLNLQVCLFEQHKKSFPLESREVKNVTLQRGDVFICN